MTGTGRNRLLSVLHVDPERDWGGGEVQVLGLARYLAGRGHRCHVLTHPQGFLFDRCRSAGLPVLPLVARNDLDLRAAMKMRRLVRGGNYDIVHFHTKRAHALGIWLPAGPKYVVTRRMDYPEPDNWYTRHLYNRTVDGVVAISSAVAVVLERGGVRREAIRLIPSGVDAERFRAARARFVRPGDPPVVGTAAVLEERKGHRFLLEAAALLKERGMPVKVRLAGDGALRRELERSAARLGLDRDVEFSGFVDDVARFLAEIDVFVLPSLAEGLGVSVLEAMAAAKPVVASRVGGLADLVVDRVTGALVPPGDVRALADAVERLARDRELAAAMGRRGAERVEREFTMERMAEKNEIYYYDLIEEAAESRSARG
ncbi:MAG TPA: glycosyltransferase family 4 protein [candidate division Zixibacteria bacterium]|nr:glycosyltransferase family 4 protein [candidate division Zixibacteria bacterium]